MSGRSVASGLKGSFYGTAKAAPPVLYCWSEESLDAAVPWPQVKRGRSREVWSRLGQARQYGIK
jgi:hypothetical protein